MPGIILAIVAIAAAVGLGFLVWFSVQSLKQAALLRTAVRSYPARRVDQPAAVHGPVRVPIPLERPESGPCLWWREVVTERVGYGRRRHRRTLSDQQKMAPFVIDVSGTEVHVEELPTEVHAADVRHDRHHPGFLDAFTFGAGTMHTRTEWLPIPRTISVVGRLRAIAGGMEIVRDPMVGLLISSLRPEEAASKEALKGWAGIAGAVVLVIVAVVFLVQYREIFLAF